MRRQIGAVTGVLQTGAADLATATAYPNSNGCFRAANSSKSRWGLGRQLTDRAVLPVLDPKRPSELTKQPSKSAKAVSAPRMAPRVHCTTRRCRCLGEFIVFRCTGV
jgi:hypothetical protein